MFAAVLSVIVVNRDGGSLLEPCLRAIEAARGPGSELIVVDNASTDGSRALVRSAFPAAQLVELDENTGFSGGVAHGLAVASGDWVALVNNDAEVEPDAFERLLAAAAGGGPRVGAVTGQVRFWDRRDVINTAGIGLDCLGLAYDRLAGEAAYDGDGAEDVFGASACVVAYRRAMLDELGGLDPSFFAFLEDADLAWRARMAGWRTLYVPGSVAYHHGSATATEASAFKYFLVGRNRIRLLAKNATTGQLLRWGWAMALYELAYVTFVALTDRTLAPLRGRLAGLREWRAYRRAGAAARRPLRLEPPVGVLGAWRQRAAYRGKS